MIDVPEQIACPQTTLFGGGSGDGVLDEAELGSGTPDIRRRNFARVNHVRSLNDFSVAWLDPRHPIIHSLDHRAVGAHFIQREADRPIIHILLADDVVVAFKRAPHPNGRESNPGQRRWRGVMVTALCRVVPVGRLCLD